MRAVILLVAHILITLAKLVGPGGVQAIVVYGLIIKHQLIVINEPKTSLKKVT